MFTSAYRRVYKKPLWDEFGVQEWERKLQYRSDRRSLEHRHEPWLWDSDTDEEDVAEVDDRGKARVFDQRVQRVPKLAWNDDEEAKDEVRSKEKIVEDNKERAKDLEGKSAEKHDEAHPKRDRVERQRRQIRTIKGKSKRRPLSESTSKRAKDSEMKHKSPPFLPYGCANRGVAVENMKTYNVFASPTEVHELIIFIAINSLLTKLKYSNLLFSFKV